MIKGHRLFLTAPQRFYATMRHTAAFAVLLAFWPISVPAPVLSRQPDVRIDHIEITAQYVTIHFYTDANRTYTVQAAANQPATEWTNIYTARALPFADHYVVADERTNTMRFYRLFVVP